MSWNSLEGKWRCRVAAPQETILVVDDDPLISNSIAYALKQEGYAVVVAPNGQVALSEAGRRKPDLVVLDVGLPDINGVEVCRRIRRDSSVPIMFLTARQEEVDKVVGLDAGGDEYIVKPIGIAELAARVRALLRRSRLPSAQPVPKVYRVHDVSLDPDAHRVEVRGKEVVLTPREFELLHLLLSNAGRAVSRQRILDSVWGTEWFGDENVVEVFIRQLRRKIEANPDKPTMIETVRGVGYRFAVSAPPPDPTWYGDDC
jgi:two-component system, OmpR family, response regulator RegX3